MFSAQYIQYHRKGSDNLKSDTLEQSLKKVQRSYNLNVGYCVELGLNVRTQMLRYSAFDRETVGFFFRIGMYQ